MNGLLQAQPQPQTAPPQAAPQSAPTGKPSTLDAQGMQQHIKNIVLAAQHVMYDPATRQHFIMDLMNKLKQFKDPAIAAAAEASDMMMLLAAESQFKMNPKALVPAGVILTGEILGFISKSLKVKVNEEDSHQAITAFAKMIMQKTGAQNVGA